MAWKKSTHNGYLIAEETVALGAGLARRYTSAIDFVPAGHEFSIISNAAGTNTSASCHDELYVAMTSGGTYYKMRDKLRDSDLSQGTSYDSLDNAIRFRQHKVKYGQGPYYKLAVYNNGVESSSKTVKFIVIVNAAKTDTVIVK